MEDLKHTVSHQVASSSQQTNSSVNTMQTFVYGLGLLSMTLLSIMCLCMCPYICYLRRREHFYLTSKLGFEMAAQAQQAQQEDDQQEMTATTSLAPQDHLQSEYQETKDKHGDSNEQQHQLYSASERDDAYDLENTDASETLISQF